MTNNDALPKNVADLTELVITQRDQLAHQSLFIDQLLEQIKLAQHHRFGVKSEHVSPDQLRLLLDEEQKNSSDQADLDDNFADQAETTAPTKRTKRGRRRLPDHLPRVEIEHTLSDEACRCEHCCSALEPISQMRAAHSTVNQSDARSAIKLRHHCDGRVTVPGA